MNSVLQKILTEKKVYDERGNIYDLSSDIASDDGELLQSLIKEHGISRSLEIGCAYGISSLYICEAMSGQPNPSHTMVDPGELTCWHNIGLANLNRAGYHFYELIEQPSELALPQLLSQGKTYQLAFIDGWHTFDHALVDFFYVNRMLEPGGIVAIDDMQMPALKKLGRYVSNYPNYRVLNAAGDGGATSRAKSGKRRAAETVLRSVVRALPNRYSREVFDACWLKQFDIDGKMHVMQKIGPDERGGDWYAPF